MKDINKLLAFTAIAEAATGVALMVAPALVGRLLLGVELSGAGVVVGRIAGLALIALGLACWPGGREARALCGMLTYNTLATLYLAYLGRVGEWAGPPVAHRPARQGP